MRKVRIRTARIAALAAGAGALAAAVVAAAAAAAPAAGTPAGGQPRLLIKPGIVRLAVTNRAGPTTTAQCRQAFGISCFEPGQLQKAYNLAPLYKKGITGKGGTIAIVDSFGSPTIKSDLAFFDKTFGLPAPPSFKIITPAGRIPAYDPNNSDMVGWAGETTLDVEWAHAHGARREHRAGRDAGLGDRGHDGLPADRQGRGERDQPQARQRDQPELQRDRGDVHRDYGSSSRCVPPTARGHPTTSRCSPPPATAGAADVGLDQSTYFTEPVTSWPDSDPLVTGVGGTQLQLSGNGTFTSVAWNDTYSKAATSTSPGTPGRTRSPAAAASPCSSRGRPGRTASSRWWAPAAASRTSR